MHSTDSYELLIAKINTFIRKYYFNNLLRGLIFLGAGLFSAYVVIAIGEYFGNFSILLRTVLFYFFILLNLGLIAWLVIPSLLAWLKLDKTLSHDEAAGIIGKTYLKRPKAAVFKSTPARITEPAVGACEWASGSQEWNGTTGSFAAKPIKNPSMIHNPVRAPIGVASSSA